MTKELEFEIIYPKIIVYKNVFNDVDKFLEQSKNVLDGNSGIHLEKC